MKSLLASPAGIAPLILVVSALLSQPLSAQERKYEFEFTPTTAYRVGGSFDSADGMGTYDFQDAESFGFTLNGRANREGDKRRWEFLYARQQTEVDASQVSPSDPFVDLDIDSYHLGGLYLFDGDSMRPFISMTLGATRFEPGPSQYGADTFFSASLGTGVQLNARGRFGIRLEARAFTTFVGSDSSVFCRSDNGDGSCLIIVDGSTMTQWEARAGLVFRF